MRLQNRRALGAGVLALGAALVLAGCGAGQITQTDSQQPAVNGTYAQVKTLVLRDAAVQYPPSGPGYPAGATPALTLTIVNQGAQDDTLVSVNLEGAGDGKLGGSADIVAGHSLVIAPAEGAAPAASSSAATPSSSTSATPSSPASAPASSTATVGKGTITLPALKQPLWPGQVVKVTFVFKNAGAVTAELPVAAPQPAKD